MAQGSNATVDLNADLGESFGPWQMGRDEEMLKIVSSANVACGFHGGDAMIMRATIELAKANGVAIGAHPGYNDIWGFGRRAMPNEKPEDLKWQAVYQIGALRTMAAAHGLDLHHVKAHGALSNRAMVDREVADAIAGAIQAVDPELVFYVLPSTRLEEAGREAGLRLAREIFADRGYEDDGRLVARGQPGAILHDPDEAADRALKMVEEGAVTSINGVKLPMAIDTICVHGDNPAAVALADQVRNRLEGAGWTIAPRNSGRG
ncbi:MAG: 5-oxoprolinase subunit PxpA [Azospirillaceae bacterium]